MKILIVSFLFMFSTLPDKAFGEAPKSGVTCDDVRSLRALMAVPEEMQLFNEKTELMKIEVVEVNSSESVYILSGKRRAIGNGGFRVLKIREVRTIVPYTTIYEAVLIP